MSKKTYLIAIAVFMVAMMFLGCVKDIKNTENEPIKSSSNVVEKTQEPSNPINKTTDDDYITITNSTEEPELAASAETESTEAVGSTASAKTESIEVAGLTDSAEIIQQDQTTESQRVITVKDVDSDFPKDTEDIQKYLKKVSILAPWAIFSLLFKWILHPFSKIMVRLKSLIVEIPDQRRYNATSVSEMGSLSVFHLKIVSHIPVH